MGKCSWRFHWVVGELTTWAEQYLFTFLDFRQTARRIPEILNDIMDDHKMIDSHKTDDTGSDQQPVLENVETHQNLEILNTSSSSAPGIEETAQHTTTPELNISSHPAASIQSSSDHIIPDTLPYQNLSSPASTSLTTKTRSSNLETDRCVHCILRRRKCDGVKPICSICSKSKVNRDCQWPDGRPSRSELIRNMTDRTQKFVAAEDVLGEAAKSGKSQTGAEVQPSTPTPKARRGRGKAALTKPKKRAVKKVQDGQTDVAPGRPARERKPADVKDARVRDSESEEDEDEDEEDDDSSEIELDEEDEEPIIAPPRPRSNIVAQTDEQRRELEAQFASEQEVLDALYDRFQDDQARQMDVAHAVGGIEAAQNPDQPATNTTADQSQSLDPENQEDPVAMLGGDPNHPFAVFGQFGQTGGDFMFNNSFANPFAGVGEDEPFVEDRFLREAFPEQFEEWDFEKELEEIRRASGNH